ncbi:MAG TPA: hypothetical protein VEU96_23940 [Bryobacteraceae bacterium]|nr:hypothetical protein [Bryobacteraceae bacterium]
MTRLAKTYLGAVTVAGVATMAVGLATWHPGDLVRFVVFLALFAGAATLKGRIPRVTGTYSPVFFFALLGSAILPFGEVAVASALAGIVQCTFRQQRRPTLTRICFNAANLVLSAASGFVFIQRLLPGLDHQPQLLCFLMGASVFYLVNTGLVSVALTLVEGGSLSRIWNHWCLGSLPYYLAGSLIVAATIGATSAATFVCLILLAPPMLLVTIYYRLWLRGGNTQN